MIVLFNCALGGFRMALLFNSIYDEGKLIDIEAKCLPIGSMYTVLYVYNRTCMAGPHLQTLPK